MFFMSGTLVDLPLIDVSYSLEILILFPIKNHPLYGSNPTSRCTPVVALNYNLIEVLPSHLLTCCHKRPL
jgi:hypothetical protein